MIKDIVKDTVFLSQKSARIENVKDEVQLATDLIDTYNQYKERCVGLAAPQIGVLKRAVLIAPPNMTPFVMFNPAIIGRSPKTYIATEGCMSLDGKRDVKRHEWVKVAYTDSKNKSVMKTYSGLVAEIIQHEVDHLNGVLI